MTAYNEMNSDTPRSRGDYDAAHMSPVTPNEDIRSVMINRVAWGPVFAGVAIALSVQLILNLTGIGIGVATLTPDTTGAWAVANISLGTAIWWTLSGIVAAFCGGYAAGRLSGDPVESSAGWHGLTSWAASVAVLALLVMTGVGSVMGGMLNNAGFNLDMNQRQTALPNNTAGAAANPAPPAGTASTGGNIQVPVATSTAMDNATLTKALTQGALLSAIALVFGALAAWFGGIAGTIKPTITSPQMRLH